MILIFAIGLSVLALLVILSPFVFAKDGRLQAAASVNSPERLESVKRSILKRYLEDEKAFHEKRIIKIAWDQRKAYLTNRYIDAARRLDYLQSLIVEQKGRGN